MGECYSYHVPHCHKGSCFTHKRADILVVAAGRPKAVTADMVKEGAVVIDVGGK